MKQIVFVSGKGGTGKSTLVASLTLLAKNAVFADCDVDAPNLHLLLPGEDLLRQDYSGGSIANIDPDKCVRCGLCRQVCRFDAIDENFVVHPTACEGCAACTVMCPTQAITLYPALTGETRVTQTDRGVFSHAQLAIGADGSGKLVTQIRKNLFDYTKGEDWVLIDGSPGTGCVVIASITGTDAAVVVAEPTPSGRHDLLRVLSVADHFRVPAFVCINKHDLNPELTAAIENDCEERKVPVIGKIPYQPEVVRALRRGQTPVEAGIEDVVEPIRHLWAQLVQALDTPAEDNQEIRHG